MTPTFMQALRARWQSADTLVCVGLGELRLALSLAAAAMLALWLRHQVAAVWLRAMRARLGADDLSASLAREPYSLK